MQEKRYDVNGMTCTACALTIEKQLKKVEGVQQVAVNYATEKMQVTYDETKVSVDILADAVRGAGYELVAPAEGKGPQEEAPLMKKQEEHQEQLKKRFWTSVLFTLPVFYTAMGPMVGLPQVPGLAGDRNVMLLALTQLFLTIPVMLAGREFYITGFKTLFKRNPNMDSLVAVGTSAAFVYGVYVLYAIAYGLGHGDHMEVSHYGHELYFESVAVILTLVTLGKYMEARAKGKTSEAIQKLMELAPEEAVVLKEGQEVRVPTANVRVGDRVVVKQGQKIPVDGTVVEGYGSVDESMLTGESLPVEKTVGSGLVAGSMNKAGYLLCEATRIGEDTTLSKIIHLVENAQSTKAPIAKLADRISGVFVPIVILISLGTLLFWWAGGYGFNFAFIMAISVLVISCPCALGLATPTAIMVGTGKGAQHGVLIKSGEALEMLAQVDTVVFDKTGTLTSGSPAVTDVRALLRDEKELMAIAASLEGMSEHPLSEAIVQKAGEEGSPLYKASDFEALVGQGVRGQVELPDGKPHPVAIGNASMLEAMGIGVEECLKDADRWSEEGKTSLFIAVDGKLEGILAVADTLKEKSVPTVARLQRMKKKVVMLTGDHRKTAEAIGRQLGIDQVVSQVLPETKALEIQKLQQGGRKVAMVGDGINDAVALVQADVGMAIGNGTDVAIESADVILMRSDVEDVSTALRLGDKTILNIKQNLFWAFIYNVLGIPVAAGALYLGLGIRLNPMIAAAAMSFSSVSVVLNALRLKRFKAEGNAGPAVGTVRKATDTRGTTSREERKDQGMEKTLKIEGMSCMHCVGRVEKALGALEGVDAVKVDLEKGLAVVTLSKSVSDDILADAVKEAGYEFKGVF
ncbi:heavy metal translocating P-type ATPase [Anaerotalea alkaliphila]|uniref:Copper-exporting P-type ATPase n=1 Tax=Anaerotalea alkaliphila TaxID=2662126 RepID=A0A7X5HXR2_9FIRM|nr:heavy metal translocating P-type ATPase [Anaerotalea alkaliphila]NDL68585.1 heavy metal translocating P-type ATPase [Anaerotalea alkaliphila]